MALGIQPIRYAQHSLKGSLSGLIVSKEAANFGTITTHEGFNTTGTQPANTDRRVAFKVDDTWVKVSGNDTTTPLATQSITAESVLNEGNTVAGLTAITSMSAFVGKQVFFAVALFAESLDIVMPTFGMAYKVKTSGIQLSKTEVSSEYALAGKGKIASIAANTSATGGATVSVQAKGAKQDGIVSITEDWHIGVKNCRMTVRHEKLKDSEMRAFVTFRRKPTTVVGEQLGTGTGDRDSYNFVNKVGIDYSSVRVFIDNVEQYFGIADINTAVGRITLTAPTGARVSVNYNYNWDSEVWEAMTPNGVVSDIEVNTDDTEFIYSLPSNATVRSIVAIKIELETTQGTVASETVGTGTASSRYYSVAHKIKDGIAKVFANGVELSQSNWRVDGDANGIYILAPVGQAITVQYTWISETPVVKQFVAVFGE